MSMIIIGLIVSFIFVFFQDFEQRSVYWFLFPIIALFGGILLFRNLEQEVYLQTILINLLFVSMLLGIVFIYSQLKLKISFLEAIALGDILFFLALALSFTTVSFIVLLVFSLIFSLVLHILYTYRSPFNTVPLAGNMSLFFSVVYFLQWVGIIDFLYI